MARFAKIKNGSISFIADKLFICDKTQILKVPSELDKISSSEIVANYRIQNDKFKCKSSKKHSSEFKIALVGNYRDRCGISTFNENLWPEIVKGVKEFKLFIEYNDLPTASIHLLGDMHIDDTQIVACWKRGECLKQLALEIKKYDPDVVLISHEWGLFPDARHWLALLTQLLNFRVIITMHSIFPYHVDKTICEAAMPEIVSHLEEGRVALRNKGVAAKTYLIPHGCYPYNKGRLWNAYRSEKTFMQIGFGFRYKHFEYCIRATAILKKKYPDIFFTALFSESPHAKIEHQLYFNDLMALVDELKVQEHIAIIRGFQSDQVIESYFRTNQVAVFPYASNKGSEVFGSSGAARLAMAAGIPVISSSMAHFSDLPTIKADTPEEIASALDQLFIDISNRDIQISRQIKHIEENNWNKMAQKYLTILSGDDI